MMQKVAVRREFEAGLRHRPVNSRCQPSTKWLPFSNCGKIRQRKERAGLRLSSAVPKIQWDSNTTAPTTNRLWKTFIYDFMALQQWVSSV